MRRSADVLRELGRHAKKLRLERGLRQRQVGAALGFDVSAVSRAESGERDLRCTEMAILAKTLGVGLAELVGPVDELLKAPEPKRRAAGGRR